MLDEVMILPIITADVDNYSSLAKLVGDRGIPIKPLGYVLEDVSGADTDRNGLITRAELATYLDTRLTPAFEELLRSQGLPEDIAELLLGEGRVAKDLL
jgi:hypothetical protein